MNWHDVLKYKGAYVGRRTAYVIDVTLGAELVVVFGRINRRRGWNQGQAISIEEFWQWCNKYKAKKVNA